MTFPKEYFKPFFHVEMPLDACGRGPETDPSKIVVVTWEVWDQLYQSFGSFDTAADAQKYADELNETKP